MAEKAAHELVPSEEMADAVQEIEKGPKEISIAEYHTIHSGPIPDPDTLAGYERILPGAADRILKMAEKQEGPFLPT